MATHHMIIPPGFDEVVAKPPKGDMAQPWNWTGYWQGGAGVAVGPHHVLTVAHLGGKNGDSFTTADGQKLVVMNNFPDSQTDLVVLVTLGDFASCAPIRPDYKLPDGDVQALMIGAGCACGDPIIKNRDGARPWLAGWKWGARGQMRWGLNKVVDNGNSLYTPFETCGGATGDSGGGLFVKSGDSWQLAGILIGVSGNGEAEGSFYPDAQHPQGTATLATKVAPRVNWINSVIQHT